MRLLSGQQIFPLLSRIDHFFQNFVTFKKNLLADTQEFLI
jgi:hypothetical protein